MLVSMFSHESSAVQFCRGPCVLLAGAIASSTAVRCTLRAASVTADFRTSGAGGRSHDVGPQAILGTGCGLPFEDAVTQLGVDY